MVLLNNKEPVSNGQGQRPLNHVASPPAETSTKVPPSKANDTTEGQAEVKKNKKERKEERQKNRKKEKKELKLENHQENSKSQKPKKRKAGQEAGGEDAPEPTCSTGKKSQKRRKRGKLTVDQGVDGDGAPRRDTDKEETEAGPGKRKRKLSEGVWLAYARGLLKNYAYCEFGMYQVW